MFSISSSIDSCHTGSTLNTMSDSNSDTHHSLILPPLSSNRATLLPLPAPSLVQQARLDAALPTSTEINVNSRNYIEIILNDPVDHVIPVQPSEIEHPLRACMDSTVNSMEIDRPSYLCGIIAEYQSRNVGIVGDDEAASFAQELDAIFAGPVSILSECESDYAQELRRDFTSLPNGSAAASHLLEHSHISHITSRVESVSLDCVIDECERCGQSMRIRRRHACPMLHSCTHPGCEKLFPLKSNLKKHVESVHHKMRPYKCHLCPRTFYERCKLSGHIQTVHHNERRFPCSFQGCTSRFKQSSDCKRHIREVHFGKTRW